MEKTATRALIVWLATALSLVGIVAGFNMAVDPFGYFGTNTIGYYFSSERQFKYNLVRNYDYNAILLGDSRIAFTDPAYIDLPDYRFVNGGIGGVSIAEQVNLLKASRLETLKLVVFGFNYADLGGCSDPQIRIAEDDAVPWGWFRFAASWTQFRYALDALTLRAKAQGPNYHADGTRSVTQRYFKEALLDGKTEHYWRQIKGAVPDPSALPDFHIDPVCQNLLTEVRELADLYHFALVLVFLPRNDDLLRTFTWDGPAGRQRIERYVSQVRGVVPNVVDLSISAFSDSRNFWLDDATHFKPAVGARVVEEAIRHVGGEARP